MAGKLEIKILKDSKKNDAELHAMSLEVAQAFLILVESVTKILEQTPSNENLKINVKSGSVALSIEGEGIETVQDDFLQIVNNESTDKDLVDSWRNIQSLLTKNGLQYEAVMSTEKKITPILQILKETKKLRAKPKKRQIAKTSIEFIEGKLIEIGGKIPNIHVELSPGKKITIGCTEQNAFKARNFLYQPIYLSSWVKTKNAVKEYELCEPYKVDSTSAYHKLKEFVEAFEAAGDEIESLNMLNEKCHEYLESKNYGSFRKFLRLFIHENTDINTLHTILLLVQFFRDNEKLKDQISDMEKLFNSKVIAFNKDRKLKSGRRD